MVGDRGMTSNAQMEAHAPAGPDLAAAVRESLHEFWRKLLICYRGGDGSDPGIPPSPSFCDRIDIKGNIDFTKPRTSPASEKKPDLLGGGD
jgi:hypothetical protein